MRRHDHSPTNCVHEPGLGAAESRHPVGLRHTLWPAATAATSGTATEPSGRSSPPLLCAPNTTASSGSAVAPALAPSNSATPTAPSSGGCGMVGLNATIC